MRQGHLLPPKLQRRGLVFERKLVTVERVWWVTMERVMGYYGTCMQVTMLGIWIIQASGNSIQRVWWVTMGCAWWVTMIVFDGLLWLCLMGFYGEGMVGYYRVNLVYGSYKQVAILGAMDDHILTAVGYYEWWWCFRNIYHHFHHGAWYMGHTSKWQFWVQWTTIFWQRKVTLDDNDVSTKLFLYISPKASTESLIKCLCLNATKGTN